MFTNNVGKRIFKIGSVLNSVHKLIIIIKQIFDFVDFIQFRYKVIFKNHDVLHIYYHILTE